MNAQNVQQANVGHIPQVATINQANMQPTRVDPVIQLPMVTSTDLSATSDPFVNSIVSGPSYTSIVVIPPISSVEEPSFKIDQSKIPH